MPQLTERKRPLHLCGEPAPQAYPGAGPGHALSVPLTPDLLRPPVRHPFASLDGRDCQSRRPLVLVPIPKFCAYVRSKVLAEGFPLAVAYWQVRRETMPLAGRAAELRCHLLDRSCRLEE